MLKSTDLAAQLLSQRSSKADLQSILDSLWDRFEGADGIAEAVKENYDKASSPNAKLNMLTELLRQIGMVENRRKTSAKSSDPDLPIEEAGPALIALMKEAFGGTLPPGFSAGPVAGGDQSGEPAERASDAAAGTEGTTGTGRSDP